MSLPVTVLLVTETAGVPLARVSNTRIPADWVPVTGSDAQTGMSLHSLPVTLVLSIDPDAPRANSTPFIAMYG